MFRVELISNDSSVDSQLTERTSVEREGNTDRLIDIN